MGLFRTSGSRSVDDLNERKIELEERRLTEELARRDAELSIKRDEYRAARNAPWWNLGVAIAGILGGAVSGIIGYRTAISTEGAKGTQQIKLADRQFQTGLILNTISIKDQQEKLKALRFLVDAGLIPDYQSGVDKVLSGTQPNTIVPTVPNNTYQPPPAYSVVQPSQPTVILTPHGPMRVGVDNFDDYGRFCNENTATFYGPLLAESCAAFAAKHHLPFPPHQEIAPASPQPGK